MTMTKAELQFIFVALVNLDNENGKEIFSKLLKFIGK